MHFIGLSCRRGALIRSRQGDSVLRGIRWPRPEDHDRLLVQLDSLCTCLNQFSLGEIKGSLRISDSAEKLQSR